MDPDRPPGAPRGATVVAGVDGSPTSLRAAAYAVGLARRQQAGLVLVYVREPVPAAAALGAGLDPQALVSARQVQDAVQAELGQAVEQLAEPGAPPAEFVVRVGNPYRELTAVARERRADAVVVGASTSPGHRVAGSIALRLVRAGEWPVTVVP
ncbi:MULTISPECIES: universal stress protein [unclassified Blastococcus]